MSYKSIILYFSKILLRVGSKENTERILKNCFSIIKKDTNIEAKIFFRYCLEESRPFCEMKSIRISGNNYKIPVGINLKRQKNLICKWIVSNSFKRGYLSLEENLAYEIVDTLHFTSKTSKLLEDTHKIAESNKIYIRLKN